MIIGYTDLKGRIISMALLIRHQEKYTLLEKFQPRIGNLVKSALTSSKT
jgi:hypothetical protein